MYLVMHQQSDCHAAAPYRVVNTLWDASQIMKECETYPGQVIGLHPLAQVDKVIAIYHWDGVWWQTLIMRAREWDEYRQYLKNTGNDTEARAAEVKALNMRHRYKLIRETRRAICHP